MKQVRARNLMALTAVMALAASLAAGPAYAGQTPAPGTAASSGMAAVASGTVTSDSGVAMPGVAVTLYGWPSNEAVTALKVGQTVPTTLLATATTSSVGTFMLQVPVAKLQAAGAAAGYVNLEIVTSAGDLWFLPYPTSTLPALPSAPVT